MRFRNTSVIPRGDPGVAMPKLSEFICGGDRRVPSAPLPSLNPLELWLRPPGSGLRATWLGHSTVLLEIDGWRVLTDPVWGPRASPSRFLGPKRFQPIPIEIRDLPPLDAVIVSHDHYDHLDYPTIRKLARASVPFVTSLGVGAHLESWGISSDRITELDWWESVRVPNSEVTISATPSQHFSGRTPGARNNTFWSSFSVKGPKHAFFFSGDTGLTEEYAAIRERVGPFDLVTLEVGAFHPAWGDIHLGPENALKALSLLGGGSFLPIHWGTFNLAMHAWDEPAEVLLKQAPARGAQLLMPKIGESVEPSRHEKVEPWWRAVSQAEVAQLEVAQRAPELAGPAEPASAPVQWPVD
jgi:L-ascorbate metabolism protein UlaG (beta-lactamase superfamily)